MKRFFSALIVGIGLSIAPYLSVQLAILLHNTFGIGSAPTIYSVLAFMGPLGGISTDLIFYLISGVLVSVIAQKWKFLLSFLIAVAAPIVPEYFSIIGISFSIYLLATGYCLLPLLVGNLLGAAVFRGSADVVSNERSS